VSLPVHEHRGDTQCPSCDYPQDLMGWMRCRIEVLASSKPGWVALVSRCPRCGERSWAHFEEVTLSGMIKGGYVNPLDAAVAELEVQA